MQEREEFKNCADRLKGLADRHRLQIVFALFDGEKTVSYLAQVCGLQITMASHHLSVLLKAGIVTVRRQSRFALYSLSPSVVLEIDGKPSEAVNLGTCVVKFLGEPAALVSSDVRHDEPAALHK